MVNKGSYVLGMFCFPKEMMCMFASLVWRGIPQIEYSRLPNDRFIEKQFDSYSMTITFLI